jgi:hypothetical protein
MEFFLIISLRRCGSTFLASELDSFNQIFCQYVFVKRPKSQLKSNQIQIVEPNFSYPNIDL